jgi:hypothetical protein
MMPPCPAARSMASAARTRTAAWLSWNDSLMAKRRPLGTCAVCIRVYREMKATKSFWWQFWNLRRYRPVPAVTTADGTAVCSRHLAAGGQ